MEKRKFDLIKEDIIPFEKFETGVRPRICKTSYSYEAYPAKLKIINNDTKQVTTFNGRFCDKRVMFKLDHEKGIITIEGIIKPPKNPLKKLFWEKGFTGARRVNSIDELIYSGRKYYDYVRIDGKLVSVSSLIPLSPCTYPFPEMSKNDIVLAFDTDNHNWYASDDLTLEEVKPVLEVFRDHKI